MPPGTSWATRPYVPSGSELTKPLPSTEPLFVRAVVRIVVAPALGVLIGLIAACAYTLIAFLRLSVGLVVFGSEILGTDFAIGKVPVLYFVGFPLGGMVVGFLWPLHRSQFGATFLGVIGFLPLYMGGALIIDPGSPWVGVFLAAIVGGAVGWFWWERHGPGSQS